MVWTFICRLTTDALPWCFNTFSPDSPTNFLTRAPTPSVRSTPGSIVAARISEIRLRISPAAFRVKVRHTMLSGPTSGIASSRTYLSANNWVFPAPAGARTRNDSSGRLTSSLVHESGRRRFVPLRSMPSPVSTPRIPIDVSSGRFIDVVVSARPRQMTVPANFRNRPETRSRSGRLLPWGGGIFADRVGREHALVVFTLGLLHHTSHLLSNLNPFNLPIFRPLAADVLALPHPASPPSHIQE